jgi:DNA end-binding protein Ku
MGEGARREWELKVMRRRLRASPEHERNVVEPRSFWKGFLKLSLVTCPVAMTPATTEGEKVRFHTINRDTGNRIENRYVDAVTQEPVDDDDQVKGYQRGDDDYVMLEDEEIAAVALESTHTIDIQTFVPEDSIEWIWYDRPHYLTPDAPVGEQAFSVIREAMKDTATVAISRLVLYRRERAVMLEPRGPGIVLWTLRYGEEVRDPDAYFREIKATKPDPKLMNLVTRLIDERSRPWAPGMTHDLVQERLLDIIQSRKKGKRAPKAKTQPERGGNVIDIMDALRKSIAADRKSPGKR